MELLPQVSGRVRLSVLSFSAPPSWTAVGGGKSGRYLHPPRTQAPSLTQGTLWGEHVLPKEGFRAQLCQGLGSGSIGTTHGISPGCPRWVPPAGDVMGRGAVSGVALALS